MATKLATVYFINSGIVIFIISYFYTENIADNGGLVEQIYMIIFYASFITPMTSLVNPYYQYIKFKRWRMKA